MTLTLSIHLQNNAPVSAEFRGGMLQGQAIKPHWFQSNHHWFKIDL